MRQFAWIWRKTIINTQCYSLKLPLQSCDKTWTSRCGLCISSAAHLHSQSLNVICPVRAPCEIWQVELDLIPTIIESHGHRADERLYTRRTLIVTRPEPSSDVLIIQHLKTTSNITIHFRICTELLGYLNVTTWLIPELRMWNTSWDF